MDFELNDDQLAVTSELEKLAGQFATSPVDFHGFALASPELEQQLEDNGFFELATMEGMGPITAALAVERLAKLPYTAEIALSMLVRPALNMELPRPFAVVENSRPGRFVATAKTVLVIDGDNVSVAHPSADQVESLPDSLFAYPMAKLKSDVELTALSAEEADTVKTWLRIANACEMAGLLQAAIDATVEHVSVRKQFGRPLGTFQALRHRLSECTVLAGGVRWLALKAAWSGDAGEAAMALLHGQESALRVVYDMHQMSGAMGMTLEMDLHLWTYRLKALLSDLGGRGGQAQAVAQYCFDAA
ncbi:acyl-CoA dehydrogenase family protein [Litorivivens sp.]|uniref:acyl-CoA dehydrogenase family protein n=1 Tax=Litorivivens sp. TaxID=2020868 RepID=UPI0035614C48